MKKILYYNLSTKELSDGSGAWTPGAVVFGEQLTLGLRFRNMVDGSEVETGASLEYLKAAVGPVDARTTGGSYRLKVGPQASSSANTTAPLPFDAAPGTIAAELNKLATRATHGEAQAWPLGDSVRLKFGDGHADVRVEAVDVMLEPFGVAQVSPYKMSQVWFAELRLAQAPVAFTDACEPVLPPPPTIDYEQHGGNDGTFFWDTIQLLTMPPEFLGSYRLRRGNRFTALLSRSDGAEQVTAALALFGEGIEVEQSREGVARIVFGGEFEGTDVELLEVEIVEAPPGDPTFTLSLDTPALAMLLREKAELVLPLEIELGFAQQSGTNARRRDKARVEITVRRGLIFDALATAQNPDWMRPAPLDYVPFTPDQVIVGQLFYATTLGNGAAKTFTVDHNLNTNALAAVLLRENKSGGRVLTQGVDFDVFFKSQNSLTVQLAAAAPTPANGGLAVVISSAGPTSYFLAHTHTIPQVIGLSAALAALDGRVSELEGFIPENPPSVTDSTGAAFVVELPQGREVLFLDDDIPAELSALPTPAPAMLPAVHTAATPTALPDPEPDADAANAGRVWVSAERRKIAVGRLIPASYVEAGGHAASDGNLLFPVSKQAGTTSYFPAPFERVLWEVAINEKELRVKKALTCKFAIAAQVALADSEAQWVLVIEWGAIVSQAAPAVTGLNLEAINWSPTPILAHRFLVTRNRTLHSFGVRITRQTTGIVADKMLYGEWEVALNDATPPANAAPPSANFALRARLVRFDTRNNAQNARGWVCYEFGGVPDSADSSEITEGAKLTIA